MKKLVKAFAVSLLLTLFNPIEAHCNDTVAVCTPIVYEENISAIDVVTDMPEPEEVVREELATTEEIELIALLTMAEAEGECEEGKRLVIDTVLNRVDSEHFPNTITEVVYQTNQFSSMYNGRADKCYVQEDICRLVEDELVERHNEEVAFFTAGKYGEYGDPLFTVGNHYFCSY